MSTYMHDSEPNPYSSHDADVNPREYVTKSIALGLFGRVGGIEEICDAIGFRS